MDKQKSKTWPEAFAVLLLLLLQGCSGEPETGVNEVRWDRDGCERCRMVLSDPHFAAQVRYFPPDKRSKVAKFDDFGCALLWLEDKSWKQDSRTEIWVADHRSGEWIDARKASYVERNNTPMGYGLGAQAESAQGSLNFQQALLHVRDVEQRFNLHGLELQHNHPLGAE